MTVSFGTNQERFTWSVLLVLCNRLMTTTLAAGVLSVRDLPDPTSATPNSAAPANHHKLACDTACTYTAIHGLLFRTLPWHTHADQSLGTEHCYLSILLLDMQHFCTLIPLQFSLFL